MCHGAMQNWDESCKDAIEALKLDSKYLKAHYRLIKAKIELKLLKEAQYYLLQAYDNCGSSKELKSLETEFQNAFGCSVKPKPVDFRIIEGIGEGNFSKIFKVEFKATKKVYAMKMIEKLGAEKIKRRHPNVNNEILMEKKVLNYLSHPNIVILFSTFQDTQNLYYQMEYLEGEEVWSLLLDKSCNKMVGCPRSVTRFILAEALNAIEYMHQRGITHRDIKPENMMLTESGHLKFVDFGTSKDLIRTDLNGPEFVGTAEYMSPETIRSAKTGPATDLWSLGVVAFQMLYGYTPFIGASPYMTFLRIKRALLKMPFDPTLVPEEYQLLSVLLEKDATARFRNCCESKIEKTDTLGFEFVPEYPFSTISYDRIRQLPFFCSDRSWREEEASETGTEIRPETSTTFLRSLMHRPARRVPTLVEVCLRAVRKSTVSVADEICANGGVRPDIPWIKRFDLFCIPESQRSQIALKLQRSGHLHQPQGDFLIHYDLFMFCNFASPA